MSAGDTGHAGARFAHKLPFGATLLSRSRTRFRLWAPARSSVSVEIEGGDLLPMQAQAGGWFECDAPCGAGTRYRYRFDDGLAVPDPASRFQPDDIHGPSEVIDPRAYAWQHPDWRGRPWVESVIYELHVGTCGGYQGVIERLPRLVELGITAVELMPIADFPGTRNWGYDGVLPFAPDAAYGTPDELKALVDAAHGLALSIYLDVVYNHFGPDGNYLNAYAPQFFDEGVHTPWGAAIDFHKREVRDAFTHNALYWLLEYRFDGLRLDAVHAIDDPSWLDEMAATVREDVHRESGGAREVHLMLENERNAAGHLGFSPSPGIDAPVSPAGRGETGLYNAQWNDDAHNAAHVLLTGERESYYANYAAAPAQQLARVLAEGFAYQGEPMPSHDHKPRGTPSAHLPPGAFVFFLQNHDQVGNRALGERLSLLADPQSLRAARLLQLLCPQIPLLFMGEEWGSISPFLFFTDFHDELADAVREGRRREFAGFAAFADADSRARIPDPNARSTFERSIADPAESLSGEHAAAWEETRRLLALRREHIVPRLAGCRSLGAAAVGPAAIVAGWRMGDDARLRIAVNFDTETVNLPDGIAALDERPLIETAPGVAAGAAAGKLLARSCCVLLEAAA